MKHQIEQQKMWTLTCSLTFPRKYKLNKAEFRLGVPSTISVCLCVCIYVCICTYKGTNLYIDIYQIPQLSVQQQKATQKVKEETQQKSGNAETKKNEFSALCLKISLQY